MDTSSLPALVDLSKATEWKNAPQISDFTSDIDSARPSQQEFVTKLKTWMAYLEVTGEAAPVKRVGRSAVQPKLIKKHAEWRHPSMSEPFLSSSKLFQVSPRTFEDKKKAEQSEILLNYQFGTYVDKVAFIDEMVRVGDNQGTVVIEVGWRRVTAKKPTQVPTIDFYPINEQQYPQEMEQLKADMALTGNPAEFKKLPIERQEAVKTSAEQGAPVVGRVVSVEVRDVEKIIKNHPVLSIMDNMNLFVDPSCNGDLSQAKFIGYSFETSKAELRADGRYKNIDHIMISTAASGITGEAQHHSSTPNTFQFKDEERKRFIAYKLYSMWDVNGDGMLKPILSVWANNVLLQLEDSPFSDGEFPFIVIAVNPIPKQWSGEPDGELLMEHQKTVGALARGMIDLMGRSANGQQGMPKQFLDPINRKKFDNGEDYEYTPSMGDPEKMIILHKYPEIPQSALTLYQMQHTDAEGLTGMNTWGGGMQSASLGDVAAGVKGALAAAAKREMSILRRYAGGVAKIGYKFLSMSKDFMDDDEIIRITNEQFVAISRDDVNGKFDVIVDVSSAEEDNLKAQELAFMLQTVGPKVDWNITKKMMAEVARLRRMPDLAHDIANFEPQPDPLMVAEQEAKVALLKAQVESENARRDYYLAQAKLNSAKGDQANLDFVQDETGTTHVREMAKLEAQGEANQDLVVTKVLAESGNIDTAIGYNQLTRSR